MHGGREHGGRDTPDSESMRDRHFSNGVRQERALNRAIFP
jgi:hypothetical protein